jgi:hypothetical protein
MTHPLSDGVYASYHWKEGRPYGQKPLPLDEAKVLTEVYKLVSDPYHKHISIELYSNGKFVRTIYDSYIFDFRDLKPAAQVGWQKENLNDSCRSLIRNLDDRLILIESYTFDGEFCLSCESHSPFGILVSTQKIHYKHRGDCMNAVILYDTEDVPVMFKSYDSGSDGQFTTVLEEVWEPRKHQIPVES